MTPALRLAVLPEGESYSEIEAADHVQRNVFLVGRCLDSKTDVSSSL